MEREKLQEKLQKYLNILLKNNFSNYNNLEAVLKLEDILNNNDNKLYIKPSLYFYACSMIGYFFGKTHHYNKSQCWLEKIPKNYNNSWNFFRKTLYPIFYSSQKEEHAVIEKLKTDFDYLINVSELNIPNLLFLDHSFWYGYIDNNPKEIYQRYAQLQMKAFPSISSQNLISTKISSQSNHKIKLGIITPSFFPVTSLNAQLIHSSSISDSFYTTFLNLSKEKFEVIYIYYGKKKQNTKCDKHCYTIDINTIEDVQVVQKQIISLNLDILLFLDLHIIPKLNFVALSKLAKIQACTHGHPVTSGIPRNIMNYFISWEAAEIDTAQEHYTEELVLIPKNVVWETFIPRNFGFVISVCFQSILKLLFLASSNVDNFLIPLLLYFSLNKVYSFL